jgi:small subunit ribosomal protein S6
MSLIMVKADVQSTAVEDEETGVSDTFQLYECIILFHANLPPAEEQRLFANIDKIFSETGGKEVARDLWGRRGLAYAISGQKEGKIVVFHIEMLPKTLREVDRELRIIGEVLRHMFIKPPKGYQIVKFSEKYESWIKDREIAEQNEAREREETLRRKVVQRAAKRSKPEEKKPLADPLKEKDLEKELKKIISDEDLDI